MDDSVPHSSSRPGVLIRSQMLKGGNGHDLIEIDEVDKRSDNFVNNYHSSNPKNLASEVQMDILENGHNSDSALEKACSKSDVNKVTQYKKTMEQQITELNLRLVEMSTLQVIRMKLKMSSETQK